MIKVNKLFEQRCNESDEGTYDNEYMGYSLADGERETASMIKNGTSSFKQVGLPELQSLKGIYDNILQGINSANNTKEALLIFRPLFDFIHKYGFEGYGHNNYQVFLKGVMKNLNTKFRGKYNENTISDLVDRLNYNYKNILDNIRSNVKTDSEESLKKRGKVIKETFKEQFNKIKRIDEYDYDAQADARDRRAGVGPYEPSSPEFSAIDYLEIEFFDFESMFDKQDRYVSLDTVNLGFNNDAGDSYSPSVLALLHDYDRSATEVNDDLLNGIARLAKSDKSEFSDKELRQVGLLDYLEELAGHYMENNEPHSYYEPDDEDYYNAGYR